jgi:hypothetical protein
MEKVVVGAGVGVEVVAVVVAVEGMVVNSTDTVGLAKLTLTRKSIRVGEATRATPNAKQRRLEPLMPKLRALSPQLTTGAHLPQLLTLGLPLWSLRPMTGLSPLMVTTLLLLKARRVTMAASQGNANLRKKITPSPTTSTSPS